MQPGTVGPLKQGGSSLSPSPLAPTSKWPVSTAKPTLACKAAHGTKLLNFAVENSGWKVKLVGEQSLTFRLWKPFAALATMKPDWPLVISSMRLSKPSGVSLMVILSVSPWFISRVWAFGVKVAAVALSGPGGPVGMPSIWMKAKLVGSMQLLLQKAKPLVHSRLLMCSEAHQWVASQLICEMNG